MIEETPMARHVCEILDVPIQKMDQRTYVRVLEQALAEAVEPSSDEEYVDDLVSGLLHETAKVVQARQSDPERVAGKTQVQRELS